jgi:Ca2+-dependent lipid-binding protein
MKIEIFKSSKSGKHKILGHCSFDMDELRNQNKRTFQIQSESHQANLCFDEFKI